MRVPSWAVKKTKHAYQARARGMSQLARDTGLAREGLYRALSPEGNPEFATVMKVIKALGLKLGVQTVPSAQG